MAATGMPIPAERRARRTIGRRRRAIARRGARRVRLGRAIARRTATRRHGRAAVDRANLGVAAGVRVQKFPDARGGGGDDRGGAADDATERGGERGGRNVEDERRENVERGVGERGGFGGDGEHRTTGRGVDDAAEKSRRDDAGDAVRGGAGVRGAR